MTRNEFFKNRIGRIVAGLVPAAGLTFGLYWAMDQLVDVQGVELNERTFRPLVKLTPPEEPDLTEDHMERATLPTIDETPPPKLREIERMNADEVRIELAEFEVPVLAVPTGGMEGFLQPVSLTDREQAVPVRQPIPEYPESALRQGLEGECEVVFSIDAAGRPFGAEANCSHQVFTRSSQRAVERALFATKVKNGVPVGQDNLVYPIQFTLNE